MLLNFKNCVSKLHFLPGFWKVRMQHMQVLPSVLEPWSAKSPGFSSLGLRKLQFLRVFCNTGLQKALVLPAAGFAKYNFYVVFVTLVCKNPNFYLVFGRFGCRNCRFYRVFWNPGLQKAQVFPALGCANYNFYLCFVTLVSKKP